MGNGRLSHAFYTYFLLLRDPLSLSGTLPLFPVPDAILSTMINVRISLLSDQDTLVFYIILSSRFCVTKFLLIMVAGLEKHHRSSLMSRFEDPAGRPSNSVKK